MTKRLIIILLAAVTFASCAPLAPPPDADTFSVVATLFAPYDFARQIAGSDYGITLLLPPAAESHTFEPTPRDIAAVQSCDVFIYTGGESDAWVDTILASMDTTNMQIVAMLDCVTTVDEEIVEGMQADDDHDEPEPDEHVWTSPKNAMLILDKIADAMCAANPQCAEAYRQNAADYSLRLEVLDIALRSVVDSAARRTVVFGDRFPFRYLADEYGLEYFAAFPGCSTESDPSAETVRFLIDKVAEENIPVVYYIELSSGKMADTIAESTGAQTLELHSCHNITKDDFNNGVTYYDLMSRNLEALRRGLN